MLRRLPYLLLLPAMIACSKSDSSPTIDFGEGEGITYRDNNNLPSGPGDPTDWTVDSNWNPTERDLFKLITVNVNSTPQGTLDGAGVFPNPVRSTTSFFYRTAVTVICKFVIVDKNFNVITEGSFSNPPSNPSTVALDLSSNNFQKGQRYRIYYLLYSGTALYTKGHGDIKIFE